MVSCVVSQLNAEQTDELLEPLRSLLPTLDTMAGCACRTSGESMGTPKVRCRAPAKDWFPVNFRRLR